MMKFGTIMRARHERSCAKSVLSFAIAMTLAGGLLVSANRARAQARPSPATQVASVDILPLAYDYPLTLQYEFKSDPVSSWMFRLHYWPSPNPNWSGYGLGAAYRFYIADSRALTGLSVAPAADIFFFHESLPGITGTQHTAICFDIGGDIAYKWIFDQFAIEPLLGIRIGFGPSLSPSNATTTEPVIGLSVGYAWE